MKYSMVPILLLTMIAWSGNAQVKIGLSSGKLIIKEVNEVTIQGYDGSEVIIEKEGDEDHEEDERAKGLREINASGLTDNTGIGLITIKKDNTVEVGQIARSSDNHYIFKVPASVTVSYEHSTHHGETIMVEDLKSEIEISANHNDVRIMNSTGPIIVSTVHGDIDADFLGLNITNDIKLYSAHGHVEANVPSGIKADFKLKTSHGKMYTNLDFERNTDGGGHGRSELFGKTNGGGVNFSITAVHSNIYLRKK